MTKIVSITLVFLLYCEYRVDTFCDFPFSDFIRSLYMIFLMFRFSFQLVITPFLSSFYQFFRLSLSCYATTYFVCCFYSRTTNQTTYMSDFINIKISWFFQMSNLFEIFHSDFVFICLFLSFL